MQEELTSKGPEERAKLAVSMLVTGMYLGGGGGGGKVNVNMGDALTSFLQSEINNIAGSALKSVDISFGMETYDDNATPEVVPVPTTPSASPSDSIMTVSVWF